MSRADCERKCSQHLKPVNLAQQKDPICSLPLKQGNCKAFKPRFYYNSQSQKCEKFIFGGCQGNENNFPTFRDCVKKCAEEQPSSSQSSSRSSLASVLSSQTAIENPNLEIPPPQCVFNGTHKFNLGISLRAKNEEKSAINNVHVYLYDTSNDKINVINEFRMERPCNLTGLQKCKLKKNFEKR